MFAHTNTQTLAVNVTLSRADKRSWLASKQTSKLSMKKQQQQKQLTV